MKKVAVVEIQTPFNNYLKDCQAGPVVITLSGKAIAVLLATPDEEELERLLLSYSPKVQTILASATQRIADGQGIPHEEFWREFLTP